MVKGISWLLWSVAPEILLLGALLPAYIDGSIWGEIGIKVAAALYAIISVAYLFQISNSVMYELASKGEICGLTLVLRGFILFTIGILLIGTIGDSITSAVYLITALMGWTKVPVASAGYKEFVDNAKQHLQRESKNNH